MSNHLNFACFLAFSLFACSCFSAFLAPITQDRSKHYYTISVCLKTPPESMNLLLDLGSTFSWVDCTPSTSQSHSIPCASPLCHALGSQSCSVCPQPPGPVCSNDSCWIYTANSLSRKPFLAQALVDSLAMPDTNGRNPGQLGVVSEFVLSCSGKGSFGGLEKNLAGLAGLGRSNFSLPAQVSSSFSLPSVFALCLSGSPSAPGVGFFGSSGPYYFLPEIDLSRSLVYTPLLSYTDEYLIGLTSIKVNGKVVEFDRALLTVDGNGVGGTKLSTVAPYTVLHTIIYNALVDAFERESAALNLILRPPVKPFGLCYHAEDVPVTRVGPAVPTIDLVMESDDVFWRIFGSNSMVRIARKDVDAWCLGFVDGGAKPRTSVVIGGHQMVDNLLQFDLAAQRLGFTSSVLVHNTMCANFNFTTDSNLR